MDTRKIKNLLRKYSQGKTSAQENEAIEQWLEHVKNDDASQFNDTEITSRLLSAREGIDARIKQQPVSIFKRNLGKLGVAASLLLISGTAALLWFATHKPADKVIALQAVNQKPAVTIRKAGGWVYLQTPRAIKYTATLSDGSVIVLNASSRLRYPEKFVDHKRPVYLEEGEALFTVAKDKTSPFTVYTTKFATTALGTAFNIRNYKNEHKISISLIHGKIRVDDMLKTKHKKAGTHILMPHEQIIANDDLSNIKSGGFDDETYVTGWKDNILSFKDASMTEVLNSIENHFNLKIKNTSLKNSWSYTGVFKEECLEDVIKTICLTEGLHYKIATNEIILY